MAAPTTAKTARVRPAGLRQLALEQLASCVDADVEATASEAMGAREQDGRRSSFLSEKEERENAFLLDFFAELLGRTLALRDSEKRFFERGPSTIEASIFLSPFPPSSPLPEPAAMRFLFAITLCILALAMGQVAAREIAGLRRLSASNADAAAPVSIRSGATSSSKSLPEITLYGEALCPDTAAFVSRVLGPLLDAGAISKGGGKGGSGAGTAKSTSSAAATPSARSAVPTTLDASASSSFLPLASQPGGGFLSAHSGGPAPTALSPEQQPLLLGGGSAGTVTINSASSSSDSENAATPAASFRFVAWGKAKRSADGTKVTCQHGPKECELNMLLECAQAKQQASGAFPATLKCYFAALGKAGGGTPASLESCVGDEALYAKISACAAGPEGTALEAAAGKETLEKQSALTFVPWVVVDGKQLAGKCGSALKAACESSKAKGVSPLSPVCSKVSELTTEGCPGAP